MTAPRISFLGSANATLARLRASYARLDQASQIAASGKAYLRPSDDVASSSRAAVVQNDLDQLDSYDRSIDDSKSRLTVVDSKMSQAMDLYQRVTELTTQAANAVSTPESQAAINAEITQIKGELIGIANSTYLGAPLFAGLQSGAAVAYNTTTSSWQFTGSPTDALNRRIGPNEVVKTNVTASQIFSNGTTDIFTVLDKLSTDLTANNTAGIQAALGSLNSLRTTLGSGQAQVGAVTNRIDNAATRNSAAKLTLTTELSNLQNVDLADAMTRQTQLNTAYQAALAVTAKADQRSLLDWLR